MVFKWTSNGLPNKTDQFKKSAPPPVAANIADPPINKEYTLDTFKITSRNQVSQPEENFIPVSDYDCIIIKEVLAPLALVERTSNGLPFQAANKFKKLAPPAVVSSILDPPINKECKLHTFKMPSKTEVIVELPTVLETEAYLEFDESEFNHFEDTEPSSSVIFPNKTL